MSLIHGYFLKFLLFFRKYPLNQHMAYLQMNPSDETKM